MHAWAVGARSRIRWEERYGQADSLLLGAMPYVLRSYIEADTREALDELSAELYRDVRVPDVDGNGLLYANRMVDYDGPVPGARR